MARITTTRWRVRAGLLSLAALCAALGAGLVSARQGPDCGMLCGRWKLDAAASDAVEPKLDEVLADYHGPKDPKPHKGNARTLQGAARDEFEEWIGPIHDRPDRAELREQVLEILTPPKTLQFTLAGQEVLIGADDRPVRRLSPGVPHVRVDSQGTAKIEAKLTPGKLAVSERYDSRRLTSLTYTADPHGQSLVVLLEVRRPGLKPLKLRSVYRPG